ncbi:MAG: hypothetical protein M1416_01835 [Candidatus Pacearchaeota archaeon]|nr:hypothetical protein [Candidatus Pacearchaeota archaeon]
MKRENKRGLSTIVITLILILLSIVAVGIVWVVINNVIKTGTGGVDLGAKCLGVLVEATASNCAAGVCDVTLSRSGTETDAIAGVKMVFRDSTAGESSDVIGEAGNIEALAGKTVADVDTGLTAPDKVEVTVYFEDASGNEQLCSQASSFEF